MPSSPRIYSGEIVVARANATKPESASVRLPGNIEIDRCSQIEVSAIAIILLTTW